MTALQDGEWSVRLATALVDFDGCRARGCPPLRWPSEREVRRAGERARPRVGSVRAHAVDHWTFGPDWMAWRGSRLGEGPADRRDAPANVTVVPHAGGAPK